MTKTEFLLQLDDLLQLAPKTLQGGETLAELEGWDSIAQMGFIALADSSYDKRVSGKDIVRCGKVDDLARLLNINS